MEWSGVHGVVMAILSAMGLGNVYGWEEGNTACSTCMYSLAPPPRLRFADIPFASRSMPSSQVIAINYEDGDCNCSCQLYPGTLLCSAIPCPGTLDSRLPPCFPPGRAWFASGRLCLFIFIFIFHFLRRGSKEGEVLLATSVYIHIHADPGAARRGILAGRGNAAARRFGN